MEKLCQTQGRLSYFAPCLDALHGYIVLGDMGLDVILTMTCPLLFCISSLRIDAAVRLLLPPGLRDEEIIKYPMVVDV